MGKNDFTMGRYAKNDEKAEIRESAGLSDTARGVVIFRKAYLVISAMSLGVV